MLQFIGLFNRKLVLNRNLIFKLWDWKSLLDSLCWHIKTWPCSMQGILTFDIVEYFRGNGFLTYGDYVYPKWADAIGWVFVLTAVLCIPTYAAYQIALSRANLSCIRKKRRKKQQRTSNAHWVFVYLFLEIRDAWNWTHGWSQGDFLGSPRCSVGVVFVIY